MQEIINANLLAQIATDQLETQEVANLLKDAYERMPQDGEQPENHDYNRLFAANRIGKANDACLKSFKAKIIGMLKRPNDYNKQTVTIGTRMFKFYYTITTHFERVHLPQLTEEQISKMSEEELKTEQKKRDLLNRYQELHKKIKTLRENELTPMEAELKGIEGALISLMPKSSAITYTPVLQTC
jgi:nitrogenase subunit NifH